MDAEWSAGASVSTGAYTLLPSQNDAKKVSSMSYVAAVIAASQQLIVTMQQNPIGALLLILTLLALGHCARALKRAPKATKEK